MAHTVPMLTRVRGWLDGAGWFVGLSIVLFVFTVLVVAAEMLSPDHVFLTGRHVVGTEEGGIAFYRWHGENYSVDVPGYASSKAVSVYLDPANPSDATVDNGFNRTLTLSLVGVPFAGGVTLLVLGLTRNYRSTRRQIRRVVSPDTYGHGLDPEFVARRLREQRRDGTNG